jgi:hypothetical protein
VLAWRFISMDKDLYQHPGISIPRFIIERNYEDDEDIPEDEQRIFIIGREDILPIEDEKLEEVFPDISGNVRELKEALAPVEYWSKVYNEDIVELAERCSYKRIMDEIPRLQQTEQHLINAITNLRSVPGAKKLGDFILQCLNKGLLLSDLEGRNVGVRIVSRGKKLPPKHRFVLYDFLSATPEEHLDSNPSEPLLLPDWAMS